MNFKFGRKYSKYLVHYSLDDPRGINDVGVTGPTGAQGEPGIIGPNGIHEYHHHELNYMPYLTVQVEPSQFIRMMNKIIEEHDTDWGNI